MDNQIPPVPPVPLVTPVLPPAEKSRNWPKILLAIIGILVVLGLFANFYLLARNQKSIAEITPTLTPGWETYANTKDGYEIKYPRENFVRVTCPNRELLLERRDMMGSDNRLKDTIDGTSQITDQCSEENVYTIETKTSPISQAVIPQTDENYQVTKEEINIPGTKAAKYLVDLIKAPARPYIGWHEVIWIEHNDKIILITLIDQGLQNIFDQMLSTFKFLP